MQHVVAAGDRLPPPGVGAEIGGQDGEPIAGVDPGRLDLTADVVLAGEIADRRPDRVATVEKGGDAPAAEDTREPPVIRTVFCAESVSVMAGT